MAPGNNGVAPQYSGGKKTNNKGTAMAKRKTGEESAQRRTGCPVLLESGCRIGESVDSKNPGDAVKMICQNPKCEYSPFIHRRCYDEWEDLLVTVMATTSWSRSWTDAQRRSNLWDKKGYQLIGKMCRCLCDKGHVRRDLDYKPPVIEDAAKKKLRKVQNSKNLPALKNPDFKSGFIGKQLPNASGTSVATTSSIANTSTPSTYIVTRSAAAKRNMYPSCPVSSQTSFQESPNEYCRQSATSSPMPSTPTLERGSGVYGHQTEDGSSSKKHSCSSTILNRSSQRVDSTYSLPTENGNEENGASEAPTEFERSIIPCVRSLLRWKNAPTPLTDVTLTEIVKNSSADTRKMINDAGGLGPALARTGYFIVGADTIRLKENGNQMSDQLPASILNGIQSGDEAMTNPSVGNGTDLVSMDPMPKIDNGEEINPNYMSYELDDLFAATNLNRFDNAGTNLECDQQFSMPVVASTFSNGITPEALANGTREREIAEGRTPSSGFDDESAATLKSAQEIQLSGHEMPVPQRMQPSRESMDSGMWQQSDSPCEFMNLPLHFYGSAPSGQYFQPHQAFHPGFMRPYWPPTPAPMPQPQMCYFREYKLFDGPSIEDLFRRELPHLYNGAGRRF